MCEDLDETLCAGCGQADCICEEDNEHNDPDSDLDHHSECGSVGLDIGIDQE